MYQPSLAPINGSLWLSALVALIPLLTVFILIGAVRMKAHWAGLIGVGVALIVAIAVYGMPAGMAISSGFHGALFGIFPITWIVLCAIFYFELTVASGHHDDLMKAFNMISPDPRVLGLLIAFSFCAVLEALAGFGAPVAIVVVMLVAIGFSPLKAALTVLIGNTFAVPFGAMATPIITGASLTNIPLRELTATATHQTSAIVWLVPFIMLAIMDGKKGVRQLWPLALVLGISYAGLNILAGHFLSAGMVDLIAGLGSLAIGVGMMFLWKPKGSDEAYLRMTGKEFSSIQQDKVTGKQIGWALLPYILIIIVFAVTQLISPIRDGLATTNVKINWPLLNDNGTPQVLTANGTPSTSTVYNFTWLSSPGTILLITGIVMGLIYGLGMKKVWDVFKTQVYKLRWTFVTIGSVLALAYVMNLSGQTLTIGSFIANAGQVFAFLAPILGWIGTAVTGSGTSTTALFATLQQAAAQQIGVSQHILVASNTVGGAVGKMIAPQTLAIAAGALAGEVKEADMLRKAVGWSIVLLVILCIMVGLQTTPVLSWMIPYK